MSFCCVSPNFFASHLDLSWYLCHFSLNISSGRKELIFSTCLMPLCQRSHNKKMILEIKPTQLRKMRLLPVCSVHFCGCSGSFSVCWASAYTASALASYSVGCLSSWKRPTLPDTALSSYLVCVFWEGRTCFLTTTKIKIKSSFYCHFRADV